MLKTIIFSLALFFSLHSAANDQEDANECKKNRLTNGEFNFIYCNYGGYTVKKARVYFYDADNNEVLRKRRNKDMKYTQIWRFSLSEWAAMVASSSDPDYIRVKVKYWIALGETKSCTLGYDPTAQTDLVIFSNGTTTQGNECKFA